MGVFEVAGCEEAEGGETEEDCEGVESEMIGSMVG